MNGYARKDIPGRRCRIVSSRARGARCVRMSKGSERLSSLLSSDDWLEVLRGHARRKGGELLSSVYANAKTRLRWRCKFNHEWLAMPCKVRQGTWCPYCARKQTRVELAEVHVVCRCAQAIGHAEKHLNRVGALGGVARATPDRRHALKYRLYFSRGKKCLVRYDNEAGKGDQRHVMGREEPYRFASVAKLRRDFEADIQKCGDGDAGDSHAHASGPPFQRPHAAALPKSARRAPSPDRRDPYRGFGNRTGKASRTATSAPTPRGRSPIPTGAGKEPSSELEWPR